MSYAVEEVVSAVVIFTQNVSVAEAAVAGIVTDCARFSDAVDPLPPK